MKKDIFSAIKRTKAVLLLLLGAAFLWTGCGLQLPGNPLRENGIGAKPADAVVEGSSEALPNAQTDGQEAPPFLAEYEDGVPRFAYESLTEAEQVWYLEIERSLGNMEETLRLSEEGLEEGLDETSIDSIFQCVLNDHPELFFVEGYTYTKYMRGDRLLAIDFAGTYSMSEEEALVRKSQIEEAAAVMLSGIAENASQYEKVKYVYETVIQNTDYALDAPDNQNIYSVFVGRRSVCQGYAKAVQYLLNRLGMECSLVIGTVDTGESHAWNLVKVDGSYYYVDATWGDASYRIEEPDSSDGALIPEINYDYLCVTTEELLRTHTLGGVVPMPACTAAEANYYVREGALFSAVDGEQLHRLFEEAKARNRMDVTVKCSDEAVYRELYRTLIEEQDIFDYLGEGSRTIAYAPNEKQLSLTFWVTNE